MLGSRFMRAASSMISQRSASVSHAPFSASGDNLSEKTTEELAAKLQQLELISRQADFHLGVAEGEFPETALSKEITNLQKALSERYKHSEKVKDVKDDKPDPTFSNRPSNVGC